jgi:carbonic anhydrase
VDIEYIFNNNRQWITEKLNKDPEYFNKLTEDQSPEILYIGCYDSRVTTGDLMGIEPDDMFVHRNIANMVSNTDLSAMSIINYAISCLISMSLSMGITIAEV